MNTKPAIHEEEEEEEEVKGVPDLEPVDNDTIDQFNRDDKDLIGNANNSNVKGEEVLKHVIAARAFFVEQMQEMSDDS